MICVGSKKAKWIKYILQLNKIGLKHEMAKWVREYRARRRGISVKWTSFTLDFNRITRRFNALKCKYIDIHTQFVCSVWVKHYGASQLIATFMLSFLIPSFIWWYDSLRNKNRFYYCSSLEYASSLWHIAPCYCINMRNCFGAEKQFSTLFHYARMNRYICSKLISNFIKCLLKRVNTRLTLWSSFCENGRIHVRIQQIWKWATFSSIPWLFTTTAKCALTLGSPWNSPFHIIQINSILFWIGDFCRENVLILFTYQSRWLVLSLCSSERLESLERPVSPK